MTQSAQGLTYASSLAHHCKPSPLLNHLPYILDWSLQLPQMWHRARWVRPFPIPAGRRLEVECVEVGCLRTCSLHLAEEPPNLKRGSQMCWSHDGRYVGSSSSIRSGVEDPEGKMARSSSWVVPSRRHLHCPAGGRIRFACRPVKHQNPVHDNLAADR